MRDPGITDDAFEANLRAYFATRTEYDREHPWVEPEPRVPVVAIEPDRTWWDGIEADVRMFLGIVAMCGLFAILGWLI